MKYRQEYIIYYLASSDKPLTSARLAELLSVSVRTIKNDMLYVREILEEHGALLIAKKSSGYWIELTDVVTFHAYYEQLEMRSSLYNHLNSDKRIRSLTIARRLVSAEAEVKLEDIADELFLSRSAIKETMREVYPILQSFHLQIDSRPGYGLRVSGMEDHRRIALTELFAIHFHKLSLEDTETCFLKWVGCPEHERQGIRRGFLKVLRESGMAIRDTLTQKLSVYLIVMRNRLRAGYELDLPKEWISMAENCTEGRTAQTILSELNAQFGGFPAQDRQEIAYLAILLYCCRDYDEVQEPDASPKLQQEGRRLVVKGLEHLKMIWGLDFTADELLIRDLNAAMAPLLGKIYFGILSSNTIYAPIEMTSTKDSPLAVELSRSFIHFIEKQKHYRVGTDDLICFVYKFYALIDRIDYGYRKARLLTVSGGGKLAARTLKDRIDGRFGRLIEENRIVELYEIRGLDQSQYDAVIMDTPEFSYNYELPYVIVNMITRRRQFDHLHNEILINNYQFRSWMPDFSATALYDDYAFDGAEAFLKFISYKHGTDDEACRLLRHWLSVNEQYFSYENKSRSVIIMGSWQLIQKECLEFYRLKKPAVWHNCEVRLIFFWCVDFTDRPQKLKVMENLTRELVVTPEFADQMFEKRSQSVYEEMIKNCLKSE